MVGAPRKVHGIIRNATLSTPRFLEGRLGTALRDFKLSFKHSMLGRSQRCDGSQQVECIFFTQHWPKEIVFYSLSISFHKSVSVLTPSSSTRNLRQFIIWPINQAFRTE